MFCILKNKSSCAHLSVLNPPNSEKEQEKKKMFQVLKFMRDFAVSETCRRPYLTGCHTLPAATTSCISSPNPAKWLNGCGLGQYLDGRPPDKPISLLEALLVGQ